VRARPLLAVALVLAFTASPAAAQTPRSGGIVLAFLEAADRGDVEAALARLDESVAVTRPDGIVLIGKAEVGPFLAEFPRPIEVWDRDSIGRGRYEARITAGGEPLLLRFRGIQGVIAAIVIEHDLVKPSV